MGSKRDEMLKKYVKTQDDEEKEKSSSGTTTTDTQKGSDSSVRSTLLAKYSTAEDINENSVSAFFTDVGNYLTKAKKNAEGLNYQSAHNAWNENRKESSNLIAKGQAIRNYLAKNKASLGEDAYKSMIQQLDSIDDALRGYTNAFSDARQYYSQWDSEEAYNKALKDHEYTQGLLDFDIVAGEAEIVALREQYEALREQEGNYSLEYMKTKDEEIKNKGLEISYQVDEAKKRLEEREAYLNEAKFTQRYKSFMDFSSAEDFADGSQYVSTRTDVSTQDAYNAWTNYYDKSKLFGDWSYDYVNRNEDALGVVDHNAIANMGLDHTFLQTMTDDEIKVYNYLYKTQSPEAAQEFIQFISGDLTARDRAKNEKMWAEMAKAEPGKMSAFSILMAPTKGISYLGQAADYLDDGTIDQNASYNKYSYIPSTIRKTVSDKIATSGKWGEVGSFAYNTGMSMGDFLFTTVASGGNQWLALALMGSGAAADTTIAAKDRGLTDDEAFSLGTIAGIAEVAMERISLGAWLDGDMSEGALKYILKNSLSEGGEEVGTSIINLLADVMIAGDKSEWKVAMQSYMDSGKSQEEAFGMVVADQALQMGLDFIGGALSGAVISSGTYGISKGSGAVQTYNADAKIGRTIIGAEGGVDALKALANEVAGVSDTNTQNALKKQAGNVSGEIATGKGLNKLVAKAKNYSNANKVGKLYNTVVGANNQANSSANQADIAKSLQRKGFNAETANDIAEALVKSYNGQELTKAQEKLLESAKESKVVQEAITNIIANEQSTMGQRSQNIRDFNSDIKTGVIAKDFGVSKDTIKEMAEGKSTSVERNVSESSYQVSEGGKAVLDGSEVELNGLRKMEDGTVVVATADNQTADPSEVQYPSKGHALIYENYANLEAATDNRVVANMDVADRSALAMAYDPASGVDAKAQFLGLNHAYWYGFEGMAMDEKTLPENSYIKDITEKQRKIAYEVGGKAAEKAAKTQSAGIEAAYEKAVEKLGGKEKAKAIAEKKAGKVVLGSGISESSMTPKEKASYEMAKVVAKSVGTDIHVYRGMTEYGKYSPETGDIWLNINANISGQSMMAFTLGHELVHMAKQWSPAKFKAFADYLLEQYGKKGISVEALIQEQIANAKRNNYALDEHEAYEEVIADACQRMLLDSDAAQKMAAYKAQNPSQWQQIIDAIRKFIDKIRKVFAGVEPDSTEAALFKEMDDFAKNELEKKFVDMVMDAGEHLSTIRNAFGKGTVVEVNADGEFTLAKGKDANGATKFLYNDYTWEKGGRDTLSAALKAEGYSAEDIKAALTIMDGKHDLVKQLEAQFPEQARINQATITTDLKDGHSVLSALVSNGDYPVNIDLLMVCKKRKAYQRVINRLCETGMIQQATVDALAIAEINKILGKYGFETACLGCFVESRRLRIQEWADTIVKEWNSEVKKRNPNAKAFGFGKGEATLTQDEVMQLVGELEGHEKNDKGNLNLGQGSAVKRMGVLLDKVPSLRKTLSVEDLITPDGLTALRKFDSNLFSMVKSRYGSNSPKFVQEFNPYNHELAKYGKVPSEYKSLREYLYAIGGARMQSFSDFIVENWFDYCQIVADLAARKLPMHTYTKEIALAKLFGLTGIKINMSLIPDIDRSLGKEFAGLTRNANGELELIWADKDRFKTTGGKSYMQSVNFADAIALQNDPRYSANVGTIAVGVSDNHILMMLDDARIRMIIPYHSSGMNPIFADLMGTSYYKDYTMVQNTTVKQLYNSKGQKVSLKLDKTETGKLTSGFQFNEVLQELGDARAAAQAYKDWCADASKHTITIKGETYTAELTPKFDDFSGHENYYKLLEDFNTYDCISEQAAPQGDVQQNYPENFDKILTDELSAQEGQRQKQVANQAFDKAMGEIESYLSTHTKADTVFYAEQHGIKLGAKDKKLGAADKAKLADLRKGMKNSLPKVSSDGYQLAEAVEQKKDLLAFHNITAQLLMDALNRNGLLMPSLAITNKGMTDFGEISLLFDKSTIDPNTNSENKLYGADAWTPTQTRLKKNAKFDTDKTVRTVNTMKNRIGMKYVSELLSITPKQFKDTIINADGSIYDAYAHNIGVQTAYAMEKGIISKIPTKKNGTVDKTALHEQISKELDTDKGWRQYKKWLGNISDTIITSYDKASNEDILNNMKAQPATAKTFKLSETGELVVPATEYASIDEVRNNKGRLSENAAEATKAVADEFLTFAKSLGGNLKSAVDAINTSFGSRYSAADIVKSFKSKGINISAKTAGELQSLYKKAVELPTQYFEAKPGREVGLDEIKAVVMPADASYAELKGKLEDLSIQVIEYDGTDASRIEALNSMEDFKFSMPKVNSPYSYDALINKPDMKVTTVGGTVPKNRADVAKLAKKNAAKVGKFDPKTGSVSVHVDDIDTDVILSTKGLRHGLRRTQDPLNEPNYIVTVKAGEILKNSIRINEITPEDANANSSYVLMGAARDASGIYVVRFVVNHFDNNVMAMDVLYAVNAKKELAATKSPRLTAEPLSVTSSTISIEELLDLVNQYFPDILPEEALKHYGYDSRPEGDLGDDALYKAPNTHGMSPRQLLADAFDELVQTPKERELMDQYRNNISKVEDVQERLRKLRGEISKLTKAKGDKAKIAELNKTAKELAELIDKYDRKLLDLEASKPLKDVLARARAAAYQEARQRSEKDLKEYRQQVSERFDRGVENRRKTEMRNKIRKVIRDLDKILNRGDKNRNVKEDMKDFVAEALASAEVLFTDNYTNEDIVRNGFGVELSKEEAKYLEEARKYMDELANLPVGGYDAWQARQEAEEQLKSKLAYRMSKLKDAFFRERQRLNKTEVAEVLGNLADAYAKLETSEYAYVNGAYHEAVYEYLKMLQEDVGGAKIKDMTIGQLEEMYKAYTMVLTTVRNANKMFAEDLKQSKEELANRVMMEIYEAGGEHGLWSKGQLARNQASWNNTKPIYAAERTGSSTFVKLVKELFKGQYNWATDMEEAKAFRQKVADKYGFKNWDMEKTYKFTSSSGIEFELNLNQIMSLYAYAKREQAHDHLLKGGFVFGKNTEVVVTKNGIKRTYLNKSAKAHNISDEIMGEIVGKLSNEQKGFVDEMQDYLSTTMGDKGNDVSMRLYGVTLFKERFYFPLRSAGQFKEKAKEAELKQQQGHISIANSGFTKAVTPKASNPVVLDGFTDVWAGHVNEMSLYHSMVLPMEDFRRVYNYASPNMEGQESASVNSFIENAYGDAATGYFDQLYKELNGGAIVDPRENLSKQMIGKFKKAAVMLSNSVVVQQFSSIGRASALIDPKYFIGQKVDKKRHAVLWDEMKQYAPVAIIKEMGGFDTHTGLSAKDYLMAEEYGKGERIKGFIKDDQYRSDIMGMLPAKADELTWCAIWEAVKRETKAKNPMMEVKSDEFLKKAGERFSEVIEKTQVYDSVLARSANMRSKQGLMQMLTAFMAEPTTTVNMIEDALRKGNKKVIARTFGAVAATIILNNALASLIYAMRDDDEDETFLEKYAQAFASGTLDDINPMTYYPILKDIWSLLQGYDVERTDMAIYSDLTDSLKKGVTLISKYDSEMDDEEAAKYYKDVTDALMGILDAGASAFGIPWKNVRRDLMSYYNTFNTFKRGGSTTWNSFVDAVGGAVLDTVPVAGWVGGKSNTDKLYDAIISGDTAYVNRLKSGYKDEDAYSNAVRKALRENDPRIQEAAQAQINGDPSERVRIAKLIIADGFSQDDVVRAINAEINAMTPGESTSAKKEKGFYTAEDFAREIANGDQATANAARSDIIQTAQKNGKTREQAEESFVSSAKSELGELYASGSISVQKLTSALKTYCDMDDDEIYWQIDKWDYAKDTGSTDGYGKYNDFHSAVQTGKDLKAVIKTYTDNGVENKTLASEITSHFKPLYRAMSNNERASIKGYLLNAYALLGYDRSKKSKDIDKWLED